jgi:hypothetical protein
MVSHFLRGPPFQIAAACRHRLTGLNRVVGGEAQISLKVIPLGRSYEAPAPKFGRGRTRVAKTHGLEARFSQLADEVKRGSELPQSELLARIDRLERQLDDLKKVARQPGPQGSPGPPGKLPLVREYVSGHVH